MTALFWAAGGAWSTWMTDRGIDNWNVFGSQKCGSVGHVLGIFSKCGELASVKLTEVTWTVWRDVERSLSGDQSNTLHCRSLYRPCF